MEILYSEAKHSDNSPPNKRVQNSIVLLKYIIYDVDIYIMSNTSVERKGKKFWGPPPLFTDKIRDVLFDRLPLIWSL